MKLSNFVRFAFFGVTTVLFHRKKPILGTIIVTDKCNLHCKHCSVNNKVAEIYPYTQLRQEMKQLYDMGIRILFFCGGETFLWESEGKHLRDLVKEAKAMGFAIVNVVTNGTYPFDIPEADLILLSIDGNQTIHDEIRGETYQSIMKNIEASSVDNICFYMAINQINKHTIRNVCEQAQKLKQVRAVSFNFHTPYPDTTALKLTTADKQQCLDEISQLMDEDYPIFNLKQAFPYLLNNSFPTPCHQCVVMEKGVLSTCGRCVDIPHLCEECGYFFAAEYALVFQGNGKVIVDMLKTYLRYI